MLAAVRSILGQVDRLCIVLNEYDHVPEELAGLDKLETVIPATDMKDTGKFYFTPDRDDVIFTIDDDILYPGDYVTRTLAAAEAIGLDKAIFGYQANAWVYKKAQGRFGWKNFMFFKELQKPFPVDIVGTGTACMLGRNAPPIQALSGSEGFVDIRFALWQQAQGNSIWALPRPDEYLGRNLPEHLQDSSLFHTVTRTFEGQIARETRQLISNIPARQVPDARIKKVQG